MRKTRSAAALALAGAALAALTLTGCGGEGGAENVRLMVWSPSEDQSKDAGEWLQTCCDRFAELHPEWDITFVYGVADEATAAGTVSQDAEASADVFMFANDTLTTLTDAGALAKIGGKYDSRALRSEALVDSLTMDGYVYGVPFTTNTWFMYYDIERFQRGRRQEPGRHAGKRRGQLPVHQLLVSAGVLFRQRLHAVGDGTQEELGADFGGEKAAAVTSYLIDLYNNPHFVVDADGSGIAGLRDGQHQRDVHGFLGTRLPSRKFWGDGHGRGRAARLYAERRAKADVRLRRVQGHRA